LMVSQWSVDGSSVTDDLLLLAQRLMCTRPCTAACRWQLVQLCLLEPVPPGDEALCCCCSNDRGTNYWFVLRVITAADSLYSNAATRGTVLPAEKRNPPATAQQLRLKDCCYCYQDASTNQLLEGLEMLSYAVQIAAMTLQGTNKQQQHHPGAARQQMHTSAVPCIGQFIEYAMYDCLQV